jgi:hypothetical protein
MRFTCRADTLIYLNRPLHHPRPRFFWSLGIEPRRASVFSGTTFIITLLAGARAHRMRLAVYWWQAQSADDATRTSPISWPCDPARSDTIEPAACYPHDVCLPESHKPSRGQRSIDRSIDRVRPKFARRRSVPAPASTGQRRSSPASNAGRRGARYGQLGWRGVGWRWGAPARHAAQAQLGVACRASRLGGVKCVGLAPGGRWLVAPSKPDDPQRLVVAFCPATPRFRPRCCCGWRQF